MVRIILERHGQSYANEKGFFAGQLDVELTETGEKQAELSAQYIINNYKIDKIYSSDLKRAYNTAKVVADKLDMEVIPSKKLREINAGKWDGKTFDNLEVIFAEEYGVWLSDIGRAKCPDGETVIQFSQRIISAITEIAKENEGKTVLIGIHATPIRVMQCVCKNVPIEDMKTVPWVTNASITVINYDNGKWFIELESYDEHIGEFKTKLQANV